MLRTALVGVFCLLAAGALAQAPRCAAHLRDLQQLKGMTEAEAIAALESMPGIRLVRIAAPGAPLTQEYRQERATLLIRDGRVVDAVCG